MELEKGTIIGHYKIVSAIGKGGMGEVYLAEDTKLDQMTCPHARVRNLVSVART